MGGLSRKRKQPRIVKKVRKATVGKKFNFNQLDENLKKHWDHEKNASTNFQNLGLKLNVKPSLR